MVVEVKRAVEFSKLEADVGREEDQQGKKTHFVEVDCFIHNPIDLFIRHCLLLSSWSRLEWSLFSLI